MALTGAVCVIGLVDFAKCWIKSKRAVKWIVLLCSLFVAFVLSPFVPAVVAAIVIMWLLILAIATIARNAVVDGLPALVSRVIGSIIRRNKTWATAAHCAALKASLTRLSSC